MAKAKPKRSSKRKGDEYLTIRVKRIDDSTVWTRKSHGKTTGLSFYECIALLLDANEKAPIARKLTDEAITQFLAGEFPDSRGMKAILSRHRGRTINHYRSLYNSGKLTGELPKDVSHRWTMKGQRANLRTGKPLDDKKKRLRVTTE